MYSNDDNIKKAIDFINHNRQTLAFVVGNGVNRFADANAQSWKSLLKKVQREVRSKNKGISDGVSYTEIFDLIELNCEHTQQDARTCFVKQMTDKPTEIHTKIQNAFRELDVPVLTTNFDKLLSTGLQENKLEICKNAYKFRKEYPWNLYYSDKKLSEPNRGFGIWHIHGVIDYQQSIFLSLIDYVKQLAEVRKVLHLDSFTEKFDGKNIKEWNGRNTWLHTIFNCSLVIIGLGLNENEIFLRWLLIERQKFLIKKDWTHRGLYITTKKDDVNKGKRYFLENVGFEIIILENYEDIYEKVLQNNHLNNYKS